MRSAAVVLLAILAACGGGVQRTEPRSRAKTGAIGGLARDHDSGDPVARAEIRVRAPGQLQPFSTKSNEGGLYGVDYLPPGTYSLTALFAGQPVDVETIVVREGEVTIVDVTFTLGRPDPIRVDFGDPRSVQIDRYHPPHLGRTVAVIEGTLDDKATRMRIPGAVITASVAGAPDVKQTVTDDQGRYRFDGIEPGTYSVSTYYSVSGHGQIEVRRSGIAVAGAEAVIVPLIIDSRK